MPSFLVFCLKFRYGIWTQLRLSNRIWHWVDNCYRIKRNQGSLQTNPKNTNKAVILIQCYLCHWMVHIGIYWHRVRQTGWWKFGIWAKVRISLQVAIIWLRWTGSNGVRMTKVWYWRRVRIKALRFWIRDFRMTYFGIN